MSKCKHLRKLSFPDGSVYCQDCQLKFEKVEVQVEGLNLVKQEKLELPTTEFKTAKKEKVE